eukprot:6472804-Amphidinium_carterae.1
MDSSVAWQWRPSMLVRSNKQAYANEHGYRLYHFETPFMANAHPWMNKLIAIQRSVKHEHHQ